MNAEIVYSFQSQNGLRGAHFYDGIQCRFMPWDEVVKVFKALREKDDDKIDELEDRILESIMVLNPDNEYVLVSHMPDMVTVECFRELTQ